MGRILIIDNQQLRREKLSRYLSEAGYQCFDTEGLHNTGTPALTGFDMVIINFHPDADRTWGQYFGIKQQHPALPILVYAEESFQAFRSLKQAIATILYNGSREPSNILCPCRAYTLEN